MTEQEIYWTLEVAATVLGLVSVFLLSVGNGRGWGIGAVMILMMGVVYYAGGLFGSAALQLFFLVTQYIGWRRWRLGTEKDLRKSSRRLQAAHWGILLPVAVLAYASGVWLLRRAGGEAVWVDSFVTTGSVVAQSLMVLGYGECWLWWLAVDVVYVWLMWDQNLFAFLFLYLVFCAMALNGWSQWTREDKC